MTRCPICQALPSQPCDWDGWPYAQPHPEFHSERLRTPTEIEAEAMSHESDPGKPPSVGEFEKAVGDIV